jgi:DNA-binding transcriptional regulator YiaG
MRQLAQGEEPTPGIFTERTIRLERLRLEKFDEAIRLRLEMACTDTEISRALNIAVYTVRSWLLRQGLKKPDGCSAEQYKRRLRFFAEKPMEDGVRSVFAVCGFTRLNAGLEGLVSVLAYRLEENPYSGDVYVFCSKDRCRLRFIRWDGSGFQTGSRKIERGRYPWPGTHLGKTLEITQDEFQILLTGTSAPLETSKSSDKKRLYS